MHISVAVVFHHIAKIYSSRSEAFHIAYANETEVLGVDVVSKLGGVEVGRIVVLPGPGSLGGWLAFELIGRRVALPGAQFGNIYDPTRQSGP